VAATLETAAKGVIYEHQAQSTVAQKLAGELRGIVEEIRKGGAVVYDHEAAITLRAIEQGARTVAATGGAPDTYLSLIRRLLQVNRAASDAQPATPTPGPIILP